MGKAMLHLATADKFCQSSRESIIRVFGRDMVLYVMFQYDLNSRQMYAVKTCEPHSVYSSELGVSKVD